MLDAKFQYTDPMMPWLVAEVLRFTEDVQALLMIKNQAVVALCARTGRPLFEHHATDFLRHMSVVSDVRGSGAVDGRFYFLTIFRTNETYLHCRLLSASSHQQVTEIMSTLRESARATRPVTPATARHLTDLPAPGESVSFEVFYLGKLRMSTRKAPVSFIDDAIEQFKAHEQKRLEETRASSIPEPISAAAPNANVAEPPPPPSIALSTCENNNSLPFSHPLQDVLSPLATKNVRNRNASGEDSGLMKSLSLPLEPGRSRALSAGHSPRAPPSPYLPTNRTMLLILCRSEVRIISPDAKSVLLNKPLTDMCHLARGVKSPACFGFICREAERVSHSYVGFVFRCESESVAEEVLKVLRQATSVTQAEVRKESGACEHCPMVFFHKLCVELEGLSDERQLATIARRVELLPETERASILAKFEGAEPQSASEQAELYMMLLRAHCESRQHKHTHDSEEGRGEFLQQALGGGAILLKARRSIAQSFDQLLKPRKPSAIGVAVADSPQRQSSVVVSDSPLAAPPAQRPRSSTIGALSSERVRCENMRIRKHTPASGREEPATTITNIFAKQTPAKHGTMQSPAPLLRRQGWRQAIFKRVVSPQSAGLASPVVSFGGFHTPGSKVPPTPRTPANPRRSRAELRELWRTAIRQQILLLRMEKQNFMLRAQQEEATVKRSKLHYVDLGTCDEEANETWDLLISQCAGRRADTQILASALRRGVPKTKRGQVWQLFMQQNRLGGTPFAAAPNTPYEELLRCLTSQQHAILIDLGRTFPNHEYFSGPLGSGQLALFNLLKAYSLLDPAVGYCQGLSFVAGLLLMHFEEEEAFESLRYLMFELGGRELYGASMEGLQVRMYQLTRLIHDHDADLHLLLHHNDVPPSLYAAPWFLTLFSSQFPLGLAVRVLDLVFLLGFDVLVPFALALVLARRSCLLQCSGLEAVMECFKTQLTRVSSDELDDHLRRVLALDWEKQLLTYAVEYSVMHDDSFTGLHALAHEGRPETRTKTPQPAIKEEATALEHNFDRLLQHVTLLEGLLLGGGLTVPARPKLLAAEEESSEESRRSVSKSPTLG